MNYSIEFFSNALELLRKILRFKFLKDFYNNFSGLYYRFCLKYILISTVFFCFHFFLTLTF